jgi:hypothetical protein
MQLEVGSIVRHPKRAAWGPGKILKLEGDSALVFFAEGGTHNGLIKNPVSLMLKVVSLEPAGISSHPRLDHLPPLVGDSLTENEPYVTLQQGIDRFLDLFPEGFYGTRYDNEERGYKWQAHLEAVRLLSRDVLHDLIRKDDWGGVTDRALRVVQRVNLLFPQEQMAIRDGVKGSEDQRRFALALFGLLHGAGQYEVRFADFAETLSSLPQKQARVLKWPVQTILPFLLDPAQHMFLKPQVTRQAARRCAFDLKYDPHPNWTTYSQLLELCRILYRELGSLRPRDYIDLQSFIWCIGDDSYQTRPSGDKPFKP